MANEKIRYERDELLNKYRAFMRNTNVAPEYIDWGFYFSILTAGTGKYGIGAIYENDLNPLKPDNKDKNRLVKKVDTMEMNLFVMIVGEPGSGKTNAIKHLPKFFKRANKYVEKLSGDMPRDCKTNILPEDMTPEAMIKHLAKDCEQEIKWKYRSNEKGGLLVPVNRKVSIGTLIVNEMGSCYGNRNDDISGVFNQCFDGGSFSSRRISRSSVDVDHSCVSLIGAATPSWFGRIAKTTSADEGLLSRFVILNGALQADPYFHSRSEKEDLFFEEFAKWLHYVAMNSRMLYVTEEVCEQVEALHKKEFINHKNNNPHLREYFKRRKRHHWPLAQILKLSEDPSTPFVEYHHFVRASNILRHAEKRMAIPFMEALRDIIDKVKTDILREFNKEMDESGASELHLTFSELFSSLQRYTDGKGSMDVKNLLQQMGIIKPAKILRNKGVVDGYKVLAINVKQALKNAIG